MLLHVVIVYVLVMQDKQSDSNGNKQNIHPQSIIDGKLCGFFNTSDALWKNVQSGK
jgi:hypothetical protein